MKILINNVEELMDHWSKDSKIDDTEISRELSKIGNLHAKYSNIMLEHRIRAKKYEIAHKKLYLIKWQYYRGDLNNKEDLEKYNLEPFLVNAGTKQNVNIYIDGDKDLNNLLLKKMIDDEIVEYCKNIIKELSNRTWQLKTMVDWNRYTDAK